MHTLLGSEVAQIEYNSHAVIVHMIDGSTWEFFAEGNDCSGVLSIHHYKEDDE